MQRFVSQLSKHALLLFWSINGLIVGLSWEFLRQIIPHVKCSGSLAGLSCTMYAQLFTSWISLAISVLIGILIAKTSRVEKWGYIVVTGTLTGAGLQMAYILFGGVPLRWFIYLASFILSFGLSYMLFSQWRIKLRIKVTIAVLTIIFLHTIFRLIVLINW